MTTPAFAIYLIAHIEGFNAPELRLLGGLSFTCFHKTVDTRHPCIRAFAIMTGTSDV